MSATTVVRRPSLIIAVTVAVLLALVAAPSQADPPSGLVSVNGSVLEVTASTGSALIWVIKPSQNSAVVTVSPWGNGPTPSLSVGNGCTASGASVQCTGLPSNWTGFVDLRTTTVGQKAYVDAGTSNSMVMLGGSGDDEFIGGYGADRFAGMRGADKVQGGDGLDTVDYSVATDPGRTQGVTVDLWENGNDGSSPYDGTSPSGMGGDHIYDNVENVLGTDFPDTLSGTGGQNSLTGFRGNDTLTGRLGSDRLVGGFGNDTLNADDGEADAEVNCNNSDGSQNEQPNTVNWDRGLDNPVNCGNLDGGGGSGGGGSGGGSGGPGGKFTVLDAAGSWTIPTEFAPRENPRSSSKQKWLFRQYSEFRQAAKKAAFPVRVFPEFVSSRVARSPQVRFLEDRDIIDIRSGASRTGQSLFGKQVVGTADKPAKVYVLVYDEVQDLKPGQCPYKGRLSEVDNRTLADVLDGASLANAMTVLDKRRCKYTLSTRYGETSDGVATIERARIKKVGFARYVVQLSVKTPAPTLSLVLGPPEGRKVGPTFSEDGELPYSPETPARISVQAFQSSTGLPATGGTLIEVSGQQGVLDSARVKKPGPVDLSFRIPANAGKTLTVSAQLTGKDNVGDYTLTTQKKVKLFRGGKTLKTVDGRCLAQDRDDAWTKTKCDSRKGSSLTSRGVRLVDATNYCKTRVGPGCSFEFAYNLRVCKTLVGENAGFGCYPLASDPNETFVPPTRDRALEVCKRADASWKGGKVGSGYFMGCFNTEARNLLVKEFDISAVSIGLGDTKNADLFGFADAEFQNVPAAARVDGALVKGTTPALIPPDGKAYLGLRIGKSSDLYFDARRYASALINLDGGTLINLDGGTLINLDGGTLINLDGGTLISDMGGAFTPQVLENSVLLDAANIASPVTSPPQFLPMRGEQVDRLGDAFVLKDQGALLGKVK